MDFYMIEKFKLLLRNGCWPISPHGIQLDSEDSFDSAAEEDDEEYLSKIFHSHSMPSYVTNLRIREASEENIKKIIIKEMPVTEEYEDLSDEDQSNIIAAELVEGEEREKLRVERRKERKRRKRERKKAEKEARRGSPNGDDTDDEEEEEKENEKKQNVKKRAVIKKDRNDSCADGAAGDGEDSEDFLDFNSAFVTKVVKHKLRNNLNNGAQSKSNGNGTSEIRKGNSLTSPKHTANGRRILTIPDRNILLGERLAAAGYDCASKEQYEEAIELFTRALRNVPNDHRYWGNRSFCYFNMGQYDKALGDAECAIRLAPTSPKGHYRKAEALAGLRDLVAAEESFQRVLELDADCEDARQELLNIRVLRITEMGFPAKNALKALKKHTTMEDAVEALMANEDFPSEQEDEGEELYNSEEDEINWDDIGDSEQINGFNSSETNTSYGGEPPQTSPFGDPVNINGGFKVSKKLAAMDPSNPNRCVSIWVGNIEETVTEKTLNDAFSRFGQILSIRMLSPSHCAFINFKDSKAPGPAMAAMQGKELAGKNLLIRYPNKTKEEQQIHQQMVCHQKRLQSAIGVCGPSSVVAEASGVTVTATVANTFPAAVNTKTTLVPSSKGTRVKLKGPVNGDECYYWRTTGCAFGDHCRNKHIKEHRGIDRKPWHK